MKRFTLILTSMALLVGCQDLRTGGYSPPGLGVTGTAEVAGAPDVAIVRMGAEVQAEQASAAQKQVNQIMQKAIAAVRDVGIPREDLQTSTLSLEPVYDDSGEHRTQKLIGYRAQNVLEIRLTDLSKSGAVIDASIAAGAIGWKG